jgi:RNA polymerase sigma-54 factor
VQAITTYVFARQKSLLEHGLDHAIPINMSAVAKGTGLHESTVSRSVRSLIAATPQGPIEVRHLFAGRVRTADGTAKSSFAVKQVLREVIATEPPGSPLTDGAIVIVLRERGIKIARRTVAKYREALGIPPARLRRRLHAHGNSGGTTLDLLGEGQAHE